MNIKSILFVAICLTTSSTSWGISFDILWNGSNDYTMTGAFSFSDALINTGNINGSQIDTLFIEGFQGGSSIGSWDMSDGSVGAVGGFNFNFDTTTEAFLVGGISSINGQLWNFGGDSGFGFGSGQMAQLLTNDGSQMSDSTLDIGLSALSAVQTTVVQTTAVPVPAAVWLFGTGLLGLIGIARRDKA